jgi:multidrug efflux pump subunit AcrA (membrane-fusion protein)
MDNFFALTNFSHRGRKVTVLSLWSVLVGAGLLLTGCSEQEERAVVAAPVRTVVLADEITDPFRRFPGEVKASQTSEMSFDVPGRLIERPVTQGSVVAQGDGCPAPTAAGSGAFRGD